MKKLMIAMAVVAMSVAARASNVSWGGNTSAYTGVDSGYGFYLIDAANYATADAAAAALIGGTMATSDIWYSKTGVKASSGKIGVTVTNKGASGNGASSHVGTGAVEFWSIAVDGTVGTDGTAQHYFSMTGEDPFSATASAADLFQITLGDVSKKSTWQSVPEPTSGLLLLIGVAGLALRRRRA